MPSLGSMVVHVHGALQPARIALAAGSGDAGQPARGVSAGYSGAARGLALEIGIGSGLNLPLYGPAVDQVYGIDPSPQLLARARKRVAEANVSVSLVRASAEQLPFADAAFDTLVT